MQLRLLTVWMVWWLIYFYFIIFFVLCVEWVCLISWVVVAWLNSNLIWTYFLSCLPGRCEVGLSLSGHQSTRWGVEVAIVRWFLLYFLATVCTYVCKFSDSAFSTYVLRKLLLFFFTWCGYTLYYYFYGVHRLIVG